jgi:hypothetical protein
MEDGALEDTGRVDAAHGLCRAVGQCLPWNVAH